MRPLLMCIVVWSSFLIVSRLVAAQENEKTTQTTIQVVSQSYCRSELYPEIGHLRFDLKVTFRNNGQRSIILCKKYLPYGKPTLYEVGRDGGAGSVVYSPIWDPVGFDVHYPKSLSKDFAILLPGDSTAESVVTEIYFRAESADPYHHSLPGPGRYFLAVEIETWNGPPDVLTMLQKRWKSQGDLVGEPVFSKAVVVSINPPEELLVCKIQ